jgi:ribosome-associated translation inhibitor RaiA
MTVVIQVGRRMPKKWLKRTAIKVKGLMTFQENIWQIISESLKKAKRRADADGRMKFILTTDRESEDLNFNIEWNKMVIMGTEEMEKEEYEEAMAMYSKKLSKQLKKDFPTDDTLSKHLKSKILSQHKIKEAYEAGYGAVGANNIANKLLEMGILTHIEWIKDFDTREELFI